MTMQPAGSSEPNVLLSWLMLLRRRWRLGVAVFITVFGYAAFSVLTARPVYQADARLRIGEPPPTTGVGAGSLLGFMRMGGDPFANDLELMGSRTVTEAVVRDAVLTLKVRAPKGWHRDSLFSALSTSDSTVNATYEARWLAGGSIEILQKSPRQRSLGAVEPRVPIQLGGVTVAFLPRKPNGPETILLSTVPVGLAVRSTAAKVDVARKRRDANVAEIIYTDSDPGIARAVVNSTLTRFIELRTRIAERESHQNVDSLRAVARATMAELTRAESDLEALQREKMLVDVQAQSEAFVDRYSTATSSLETARTELQAINSALARSRSAETAAQRWTSLLAFRPFLNNATIGELLARLTVLEGQRAALAPRRTESNREYAQILEQIAYIDRSLDALANDVKTALTEQVGLLEAQVARMDGALAAIPSGTIELARRQRSARVLSEVMVLTEQRLRQEELRQALSFSNIQVIDPAALRFKPVWPRKKYGLVIGWLIAGLTAVLAMAVAEKADRRIRRAGEVSRISGAPVLAVAIRRKHDLDFTPHSLRALLHHGTANGRGPTRMMLASVGHARSEDLAAALQGAFATHVPAGTLPAPMPEILGGIALRDFASASAASAAGIPVTLVVETGKTTEDELARAAALIREAGGEIAGSILVCKQPRQAADLWV